MTNTWAPLFALWATVGAALSMMMLTFPLARHNRKQKTFLCIVGGPLTWLYGIYLWLGD